MGGEADGKLPDDSQHDAGARSVATSRIIIFCDTRFLFLFILIISFLTIFLLNGSYWRSQKILMSLISIGHVVENAMLVDVDSGARVACTNWTF